MLSKVKDTIRNSKVLKITIPAAFVTAMSLVGAFAEGEAGEYTTATSALTTSLTNLKTEALTILGVVVGLAVVIVGGYFLIRLGLKWFKGLAK